MKLSAAQQRVMKWLGHGWKTELGAGSSVMVNGQRICNTDTMMALYRLGHVSKDANECWTATPSGRTIAAQLGL